MIGGGWHERLQSSRLSAQSICMRRSRIEGAKAPLAPPPTPVPPPFGPQCALAGEMLKFGRWLQAVPENLESSKSSNNFPFSQVNNWSRKPYQQRVWLGRLVNDWKADMPLRSTILTQKWSHRDNHIASKFKKNSKGHASQPPYSCYMH